mmetsp:Transcript_8260/g.16480  ORF Transcript_8260/g.16480 Transcript_8260/m.16480 type:complete len:642 (-) Transcript_8260:64-1989(-)
MDLQNASNTGSVETSESYSSERDASEPPAPPVVMAKDSEVAGRENEEEKADRDRLAFYERAFGSSANVCSGGGFEVERKDDRSFKKKSKDNVALCGKSILAGAGMFNEAYFLFAIGNLELLWEELYPECYSDDPTCNNGVVSSLTYVEVLGVIAGMLSFGYVADVFGRRMGSCLTALIMCVCGILTAAAKGRTLTGQWIFFAVALFFFSYGVGGEFPLASASAAESADALKKEKNLPYQIRGKAVVLTFAMQSIGNVGNTVVILATMAGTGCTEDTGCSDRSLELTWRLQYAIGAFFLAVLVAGRFMFLKESKVWSANKEKNGTKVQTKQQKHRNLVLKYYWHRVFGTSVSWFVWDAIYYSNKLFQNSIIASIIGQDSSVFLTLEYSLLNSSVALVGLYGAAFVIDEPWMGRRRLQSLGFLAMFILFLICGVAYNDLSKPEYTSWFQALYYLTTFFGQFGPNATTWLLPAELFPTDVRSQAHGVAAAVGKLGALFGALLLTYGNQGNTLTIKSIFLFCAACGFVGLVVTELFTPDVSSMDMSHTDDRWDLILLGRAEDYHGEAVKPEHLSYYERMIGVHRTPNDVASTVTVPESSTVHLPDGNANVSASIPSTVTNVEQEYNQNAKASAAVATPEQPLALS